MESVDLPSLERKVLWRGPYAPSSYARAPEALYLVTERPRTLRKVYLDGGGEAWALPWTEQPVALLGFGAGQLYLSDGETVWNLPPEPAKLSLFKEELSRQGAGASLPPWLLLAALAAGVLLLLRLARELRGPSYRRR